MKSEPGGFQILWHKSRELTIYLRPISNFNNETSEVLENVLHNLSDTTFKMSSTNENSLKLIKTSSVTWVK